MKRLTWVARARAIRTVVLVTSSLSPGRGAEPEAVLHGSKVLTIEGDLSAKMLEGLHRFDGHRVF